MFSEKVHKIDMIDNIKNRLLGQVEDKVDSSDKIIDIDVIENNDLHLEEESNISEFAQENSTARKLTLIDENNEENLISTYSDEGSEIENNSRVEKSAFENAYNLNQIDTCYGIIILNGESITDSGTPTVWAIGNSSETEIIGYDFLRITSTNPNVAEASYRTEGGNLLITFNPGKSIGTTNIKVTVSAKYIDNVLGLLNMQLDFEYTVRNGSTSILGTELGKVSRSAKYDIITEKTIWGKNSGFDEYYGERKSIGVGVINTNKVYQGFQIYTYQFYAQEMLDISVGEYDTSIASVEAYEITQKTTADDVGNTTMMGTAIKVTGLKSGTTKVVVTSKFKIPNTSNGQTADLITRTMPITVYIKVEGNRVENEYNLTYNTNGGNFDINRELTKYIERKKNSSNDENFSIIGSKPIREGYEFLGWSTSPYSYNSEFKEGDNYTIYEDNPSKTLYAVWEKIELPTDKVKRDVFFTLKKVFKGLYEIPSDFSLKCNISFENESYSSILNLSNAVEIDEGMSTVYWRIPLYDPLYTDSRNYQIVKIEEFCDVEGYTYEMESSSGSINGNIITIKFSPIFHSGTRTITNTYYRDNYEEKEEYKIEYYYDNLKDSSKTETLETITEEIINSKKESGQKENYTYEKTVKEGNAVKIYYVSTGSEEPTKPSKLYTITVKNEKAGHTYNSYQVFAGDFAYDKENQPILSNIVWSEEFQKIAENEKTYGDKLIEKLKNPNENTYASLFTDCQTALDIAEILAGKEDDGAEIREFTKVTGKFILENNIKITKGVSEQTTETIAGEEVKSYKITELEAGYYIVIDAKANTEDDAYSRYLIDVVQDITMEPKSSIPTLSKKVTTNNIEGSEKVNTASHIENGEYDIGFEIVTTIGTDMDAYGSEYKYEVVDILDKGFEYDRESVKIYVGENKIECGKESYTLSDILITEENYNTYKEYFEEGEPSEQYGKTVVLIDFKDIPGKVSRGELLEGQKITINYNAKLNKNCEVGKVANVNKAYLKYSNNPYQINNTAKTKTVTTLTYTISLNIEKIGEIKTEETEKQYLSGAIFDIYDEPEYKEGILIPEKNQNRKLIGTVEIGEEGKAKYNSLGAGTYYIKESKAPDGYNMLKEEIEMKVIATYDGFDINWEVEDKSNSKLVLIEKEIAEGTNINLEIQNTRGVQLPVTGGMGTLIFTVVGIGIMGLAVIGLKK